MLTYVELRPHSTRISRKVNFYAEQFDKYHDWELYPNGTISNFNDGRRGKSDIQSNQFKAGEPPQQFDPPKSAVFTSYKGRGTACCADIDFGKNQQFKVGISHTTTDSRGYISRFYAFDMRPPRFLVVAVRGPFCLGGLMRKKTRKYELTRCDQYSKYVLKQVIVKNEKSGLGKIVVNYKI